MPYNHPFIPGRDARSFKNNVLEATSLHEVLLSLRHRFAKYGLGAFRYYYLDRDQQEVPKDARKTKPEIMREFIETESVVGVESAGHECHPDWRPTEAGEQKGRSYPIAELFRSGNWAAKRNRVRAEPLPGKEWQPSVLRSPPWDYSDETNSFLCFNTRNGKPMLFYRDRSLPPRAIFGKNMPPIKVPCTAFVDERDEPGVPNHVRVADDFAAMFLTQVKTDFWVDFPMRLGGQFVGKITVDIDEGVIPDGQWETPAINMVITEVGLCIRDLTPLFEALRSRNWNDDFQEVRAEMQALQSLNELFEYCVKTLPQKDFFNTKYASIFTSIKDCNDHERLVLRNSSYNELRARDAFNIASYPIGKIVNTGLTPRVYKDNRSLRLMSLRHPEMRKAQVNSWLAESRHTETLPDGTVGPIQMEWSHSAANPQAWDISDVKRITDSDIYESFLAVPIRDSKGEAMGVLRFTEKTGGAGALLYSQREEHLLERIGTEIIGKEIERLTTKEMHELVFNNLPKINALSIEDAQETSYRLREGFGKALATLIPDKDADNHRKGYLINRINWQNQSFQPFPVGGHIWMDPEMKVRTYTLGVSPEEEPDSITSKCAIADGVIMITINKDEDKELDDRSPKAAERLMPSARCILAAPIKLMRIKKDSPDAIPHAVPNADHGPFGVFIVASERYDLEMATHGRLLSVLAEQMAEIYTRKDFLQTLPMVGEMRHDARRSIERLGKIAMPKLQPEEINEFESLKEFVDDVTRIHGGTDEELKSIVSSYSNTLPARLLLDRLKAPISAEFEEDAFELVQNDILPDDLRFTAYLPYLKIILYNLLKNALVAERNAVGKKGRVLVRCRVAMLDNGSQELQIAVINGTVPLPQSVIDEYSSDLPGTGNWGEDPDPAHWGIHIVKTLTDWHRVGISHGRWRVVKSEPDDDWNGCQGVEICLPILPNPL